MTRHPMTPSEFDAAVRELRKRCPYLSETSGARTEARNASAGGKVASKHVLGMARDLVPDGMDFRDCAQVAHALGFWVEVHDVGSGRHLHVQGLPPGDVPGWWVEKYGRA